MTFAEQALEAIGLDRRRTAKQLARMRKVARRRSNDLLSDMSPQTLWIAIGAAAAVGAVLVAMSQRNGTRGGGRTVRDVMVPEVMTIESSATITDAARKMKDGNVGVLPVVENGRLRGILTDRDIVVRALAQGGNPSIMRVSDCATRDLACAMPDWRVEDAMRVMSECRVGRLPVVDDQDHVVGIVTLSSVALRSRDRGDPLGAAQEVSRRSARIA